MMSPTYDKATSMIAAGRDRQALIMVACEIVDALHELTEKVEKISSGGPVQVTYDAGANVGLPRSEVGQAIAGAKVGRVR